MEQLQEFFSRAFTITALCLFGAWIPFFLFWELNATTICLCILGNVFAIIGYFIGKKTTIMNIWIGAATILTIINCSFNRLEMYFNW